MVVPNNFRAALFITMLTIAYGNVNGEECAKAIKYQVGQKSLDRVKSALFLHVSVPKRELTKENLIALTCHWKKKYQTVSMLTVAVFTSLSAAKTTDFTYEQQDYPELENAYRGHY